MCEKNSTALSAYTMTPESIAAYIHYEQDRGGSEKTIRYYKRVTSALFEWLPEDKTLTKELLLAWRQSLKDHGYTQETELSYVKGINRYLDYIGCSDMRFNRGRARDIAGETFGYLTALEPTGEKKRKDFVWRCRCICGQEVELTATRLLTGNTISCGCLRKEHLKDANKYIDGTSIRQSMEELIYSTRSTSGYTGVTAKRGKWVAQIKYKGQNFYLGCYSKMEDAVKARARAKELVQEDALGLLDFYEELHKDDPAKPTQELVKAMHKKQKAVLPQKSEIKAARSNNTSGQPGVWRKRDKWAAKITYQKTTYQLGCYESIEKAIAARKEAERMIQEMAAEFPDWVLRQRQSTKKEKG